MIYKKKCLECGEWTYSDKKEIWQCSTCGAKIDNEEAIPVDKKEENEKED